MFDMKGKKVVVTDAKDYMGPAMVKRFTELGAEVIACETLLRDQKSVDDLVARAGEIDILIANFNQTPRVSMAEDIKDEDWFLLCDSLVHPLMRVVRAFLPQMKARKSGKIVAVTSASALRAIPTASAYTTMRGAQNAFIQTVGGEVAPFNVQVNAIAQNYVENETYYPAAVIKTEEFQDQLKQIVPTQKVAAGSASADLAVYLASDSNVHIVGQVIPFAGGWATST
jgi:2-keto-3-deoxy-L-fuconate dehydrogenase